MIVKRVRPEDRRVRTGALFIGEHDCQSVIGSESRQFRISELTFRDGARTALHVHDSEQVIFAISGEGTIATADGERVMGAGDIALVGAGEPHWHGAPAGGSVTLWSILGPHTTRPA